MAIATLGKWSTKVQLEAKANHPTHHKYVSVSGMLIQEDGTMAPFDAPLDELRYGQAILTTHRGKDYTFRRKTNGQIEVL